MIIERLPEKPDTGHIPTPHLDKNSEVVLGRFRFVEETGFIGGPKKRGGLKLALWMWSSAFIDGLILIAATCLFLIAAGFVLKSSIGLMYSMVLGLFLILSFSYFTIFRLFLGATIGELSCDLRLGQPKERLKNNYILKVALRITLVILSGVITLPILSLIFGFDILGRILKLSIYSLK